MIMERKVALALAWLGAATSANAQSTSEWLGGVELDLVAVEDSVSYLVYRYRVANPGTSLASVALLIVDVSAPVPTGHQLLPSTGPFRDGVTAFPAGVPLRDHVPLGAISPANWQAHLMRKATLAWFGTRGGVTAEDTVAAGGTLPGFGLRSPYLPGVRTFWAEPAWQACCSEPRPPQPDAVEGEHPGPDEFRVQGFTVGPLLPPDSMELSTLGTLLDRSCTELGEPAWIDDEATCGRLRVKLDESAAALARGQPAAARDQLESFLAELADQHGPEPGKHVNDNAYWLLKTNVEIVLSRL